MSRYLVVAHQTAATPALAERMKAVAAEDPRAEFVLLVPATPVSLLLTRHESNESKEAARRTLEFAGDYLQARNLNVVRTAIGHASPLRAIEDELRASPGSYEAIFISTLPPRLSRWLRLGLPARAERRFGLPVHHVIAEPDPAQLAEPGRVQLQERLVALAQGEIALEDLPLEGVDFWEDLLVLTSRRSNQDQRTITLARQLLSQELAEVASQARATAARAVIATSRSRPVRREAIRVLEQETGPAVEASARDALAGRDFEVRLGAIRILERQETESALSRLAGIVGRPNDALSSFAAEGLLQSGDRSIPHLERLLKSRNVQVRWKATRYLGRLRSREALPALFDAFTDEATAVSWAAAEGLAELGPSAAPEVLRRILNAPSHQINREALRHYAEQAVPRRAFYHILQAMERSASHATVLVAVEKALETLAARPIRRA